ncbi:MAG TPA: hypothetical protein VHM20_00960 [Gammaproteobacteria bacterium]|nr:hypothetical protein [Gammaproteobacteria bacterium]
MADSRSEKKDIYTKYLENLYQKDETTLPKHFVIKQRDEKGNLQLKEVLVVTSNVNFVELKESAVFVGLRENNKPLWESLLLENNSYYRYFYEKFKKYLATKSLEISPPILLESAVKFCHKWLKFDSKAVQNILDRLDKDLSFGGILDSIIFAPVVPLSFFIESRVGVCRHMSLFTAYLLKEYVREKQLPKVMINMQGIEYEKDGETVGHTYLIWKDEKNCYLIDSQKLMAKENIVNLNSYLHFRMLKNTYSLKAVKEIYRRENLAMPVSPVLPSIPAMPTSTRTTTLLLSTLPSVVSDPILPKGAVNVPMKHHWKVVKAQPLPSISTDTTAKNFFNDQATSSVHLEVHNSGKKIGFVSKK